MRVPGKGEDGRRGPGDVILRCFWQGGTGLNCYHKRDQRENLRFEDLSLQKPAQHGTRNPFPVPCHTVRPLTQWTSCLSPASLSKSSEGGRERTFKRNSSTERDFCSRNPPPLNGHSRSAANIFAYLLQTICIKYFAFDCIVENKGST